MLTRFRRARLYDTLALLTVIVIVALDQWTKSLVVANLSPPESGHAVPLIGDYLTLYYIRNSGAAFGLFSNSILLVLLIVLAIGVVAYLYLRMVNSGPLAYKLIFGMIIGGAAGNLIDRAVHAGYVVDFVHFQIPQIGFSFAIFNLADASISVGIVLLLAFIIFGGLLTTRDAGATGTNKEEKDESGDKQEPLAATPSLTQDKVLQPTEPLQPTEQDVQS